jgi:hypothetical protein
MHALPRNISQQLVQVVGTMYDAREGLSGSLLFVFGNSLSMYFTLAYYKGNTFIRSALVWSRNCAVEGPINYRAARAF